uniref:Protein-export protein SecB n=1 Tax=Arsenophonus endosymbiont of Trialeurodes vaporariorum TaxID=235567 RepID=A0A3B0LXR5_9GAMM
MEFTITKANVSEIKLEENTSNAKSNITITSFYFVDQKDKKNIKATMETVLLITGTLELSFKYNFFLKFKKEISNSKLNDFMAEINFHRLAYPYIRTYIVNLLNMSGLDMLNTKDLPLTPKF